MQPFAMPTDTRIRIAVGAMIAAMFLADMFVQWAFDENASEGFLVALLGGIIAGQFIGQLNLISVWAAVSAGSLLTRLPWALLLTTLMWFGFSIGMSSRVPSNRDEVLTIGVILFVGCLLAQIPLWVASRVYGWRLVSRDDDMGVEGQFNLTHVFLGTVLLAATLAIGRVLLLPDGSGGGYSGLDVSMLMRREPFAFLCAFVICNLLLVVPCIWAAFFAELNATDIACACLVTAVVTGLEFGGLCLFLGGPGSDEVEWWTFFFGINLGQMAIVILCLRSLRNVVGFQLIRKQQD